MSCDWPAPTADATSAGSSHDTHTHADPRSGSSRRAATARGYTYDSRARVVGVKETVARIIEAAALGIEVLAVIVIVCAVLFGTWRFVRHGRHDGAAGFRNYKQHLTKGLLLGLE